MRLLYLTDQAYLHGGVEKVLSQKLNYFAGKGGYELFLITIENKDNPFCYKIAEEISHIDLGINYHREKSFYNYANLLKVPGHFISLYRTLQKIQPDVIVMCNYSYDFYFLPYIYSKAKIIKEYHSSRYSEHINFDNISTFRKLMVRINKSVEKRYNHLVILNKDEEKYFSSDNTVIIPNATLDFGFCDYDNRENVIIAAGRIAPVKQFDHLVKMWGLVCNRYPDWELHVYGGGDDKLLTDLEKLVDTLGVINCKFKGPTDELHMRMKSSSIFAMTSATECFPMVILEALSCGLPVIAYDCPYGPRNILLDSVDGYLVGQNEIESLAKTLCNLIENFELRKRMSFNAKRNVQRFNERTVMQTWIELFNK